MASDLLIANSVFTFLIAALLLVFVALMVNLRARVLVLEQHAWRVAGRPDTPGTKWIPTWATAGAVNHPGGSPIPPYMISRPASVRSFITTATTTATPQ